MQLTGHQPWETVLFSGIDYSSGLIFFLLAQFSFNSLSLLLLRFSTPHPRSVSPQAVRWRRTACSRDGDALSVVVGFIPIRGSSNGK